VLPKPNKELISFQRADLDVGDEQPIAHRGPMPLSMPSRLFDLCGSCNNLLSGPCSTTASRRHTAHMLAIKCSKGPGYVPSTLSPARNYTASATERRSAGVCECCGAAI
jgi:hypothetical protein